MVVGMVLLAGAESAHGQLIWLGTLPGYESECWATGVSDDGSVVVGVAQNDSGSWCAFRWTAQGGMQDLGTLGGDTSVATGVSADGSVVVGWAENDSGSWRAFRWTAQGGMQDLGTLGGSWSEAYGVSADGSVVVGIAKNVSGQYRAFRWTAQGGMQDLGTLGGDWSEAYGVSADGSVVVGRAGNASGHARAFRWTAQGGMQDLGTLGGCCINALGVSADGSVVVGRAENASGHARAFRWTAAGGMQDLGTLGEDESYYARGVSRDGSVVVGWTENDSGHTRAFRWTAQDGMQDLNQLYAALLQNGSELWEATAISPNGRYIVGRGYNAATGRGEAYLLEQKDTTISVDDGSEGEFTITISPQPVAEQGWVQVWFGRFEQARVEVRDMLGRLVTVLGEGVLGEQRWQLPQLAAGMYTVMVRSGQNVAARQFVVTR
jgi:probable HAF family extracellular repeat protein